MNNHRIVGAVLLTVTAASGAVLSESSSPSAFKLDRKPETMREALANLANSRTLLTGETADDPRWSDEQIIANALGLKGHVARRLPVVDKWEIGWLDTDGTFIADLRHDLVDFLGWFSKARPLGAVVIDLADTNGPLPLRGDVNGDGVVDELDLQIVLDNFGLQGVDVTRQDGDVNGDHVVDIWDVLAVLEALGFFE